MRHKARRSTVGMRCGLEVVTMQRYVSLASFLISVYWRVAGDDAGR